MWGHMGLSGIGVSPIGIELSGVQGAAGPCRGLGCPQKLFFFFFSLFAEGKKREKEGF
jgi:hypothetical protein